MRNRTVNDPNEDVDVWFVPSDERVPNPPYGGGPPVNYERRTAPRIKP